MGLNRLHAQRVDVSFQIGDICPNIEDIDVDIIENKEHWISYNPIDQEFLNTVYYFDFKTTDHLQSNVECYNILNLNGKGLE